MVNETPGEKYSKAELAKFVSASNDNMLSFAINRNPTAVYKFIKKNYAQAFQTVTPPIQQTMPLRQQMHKFLMRKLESLPNPAAKQHLMAQLAKSIPKNAEVLNWTTPQK